MAPNNLKEQKRIQKKKERGAYSFEKQAIEREKAKVRMAEIRAKKRVAASAPKPPNSAPRRLNYIWNRITIIIKHCFSS